MSEPDPSTPSDSTPSDSTPSDSTPSDSTPSDAAGMIRDPNDFFARGCGRCARFATPECSTRRWLPGLLELRRIALDEGLVEVAKWGQPCYLHAGRNVAIFGALRDDFRLSLFHGPLLHDPDGLLQRAGPNSAGVSVIRFASSDAVAAIEPALRALLRQAIGFAAAGVMPPKEKRDLEVPDELQEALDADPELAEAFHALTPGRQRAVVLHLTSTRNPATRFVRIARSRAKILAGKGPTER
jgi:uncharacterized protein YdeI (YjbR/CyaY-like superfamily)